MLTFNEQIRQNLENLEQLKRRKYAQEHRKQVARCKTDCRRRIIIGKIIEDHFPEVTNFQPRRSDAENQVEFEPILNFLSLLTADEAYVAQLKERSTRYISLDNQPLG